MRLRARLASGEVAAAGLKVASPTPGQVAKGAALHWRLHFQGLLQWPVSSKLRVTERRNSGLADAMCREMPWNVAEAHAWNSGLTLLHTSFQKGCATCSTGDEPAAGRRSSPMRLTFSRIVWAAVVLTVAASMYHLWTVHRISAMHDVSRTTIKFERSAATSDTKQTLGGAPDHRLLMCRCTCNSLCMGPRR